MFHKLSGVIFDFDGVLTDSLATHSQAWNEAYKVLFGNYPPVNNRSELTGRSSLKIAEYLCSLEQHDGRAEDLAEAKLRILLSGELPPLFEGVNELFQLLTTRNIPFGVGSNAPSAFIRKTLEQCPCAPSVVRGYETVVTPKPAPDLFLEVAKELFLSPYQFESVIVVEDSPTGIEAAVAANMMPVGVLTTHQESQLKKAGAAIVLPSLRELINLLSQ